MLRLSSIVLVAISLWAGSFYEKGLPGLKKKKAVRPIHHRGYYKNHLYKKHLKLGRLHLNWFEKQGVKNTASPK